MWLDPYSIKLSDLMAQQLKGQSRWQAFVHSGNSKKSIIISQHTITEIYHLQFISLNIPGAIIKSLKCIKHSGMGYWSPLQIARSDGPYIRGLAFYRLKPNIGFRANGLQVQSNPPCIPCQSPVWNQFRSVKNLAGSTMDLC